MALFSSERLADRPEGSASKNGDHARSNYGHRGVAEKGSELHFF